MKHWLTHYDNAVDGRLWGGPRLIGNTIADAISLLPFVTGPNGEPLRIVGELVEFRIEGQRVVETYDIPQESVENVH